jgi:CRP-like cAMP-binding protein
MSDFEIVWCGDVRTPRRGLLLTPAEQVREAPELPPVVSLRDANPQETRARVAEALQTFLTAAEVGERIGISTRSAGYLLQRLKRQGVLDVEPSDHAQRSAYRWKRQAA